MFPRAKNVRYVKGYDVEVIFTNGEKHVVPLGKEIVKRNGEVARPLKDRAYFAKVFVNPEGGHLEWPNGCDVDPGVLYWLATGKPITFATVSKYQWPPAHFQKPRKRRTAVHEENVRRKR